MLDRKETSSKTIATRTYLILLVTICVLLAVLTVLIFINLFPGLVEIFKPHNEKAIAEYITSQGRWKGYFCISLMNAIQVVSIFLSGNVIYVASGMIYHWFEAFIVCWSAFLGANFAVYLFARTIGKAFEARLAENGRFEKIMDKVKAANPGVIVFLANLLPGIPNGLCPYLAAFMGLKFKDFALALILSSWLQVLLYCIIGHVLIRGGYVLSGAIALIEYVACVIMYANRDRLGKFLDKQSRR